jgi:catechol 2,3-dioxygenase-like lactoylglutathione lyase family enzyme
MTTPWTLTFDCTDVERMRSFWQTALGYVAPRPPEGWSTWEDFLRDQGVPEEEWHAGGGLDDPDGALPDISFLRVPERKSAKNRLHFDLQVSGGRHVDQGERERLIEETVSRLVAAGGVVQRRDDGPNGLDHVVMEDPEGNEFCVV